MSFCRIESTRHMRKTWVLHGFADFCCLKFVPVLVGAFKIQLLHLPSILFSLIKPSKGVRFMGRYTPPSNWDPTGIQLGYVKKNPIKEWEKKNHPQNRIVGKTNHIFLLHDGFEIPNNQLGWVLKPCKEWEKTNSKPQLINQISAINITNRLNRPTVLVRTRDCTSFTADLKFNRVPQKAVKISASPGWSVSGGL